MLLPSSDRMPCHGIVDPGWAPMPPLHRVALPQTDATPHGAPPADDAPGQVRHDRASAAAVADAPALDQAESPPGGRARQVLGPGVPGRDDHVPPAAAPSVQQVSGDHPPDPLESGGDQLTTGPAAHDDADDWPTPRGWWSAEPDDDLVVLTGSRLRSALVLVILRYGEPVDLPTLAERLSHQGIATRGRSSKRLSDALRTELRRGRVRQLGRGRYAPGRVTRQDRHRLRTRVDDAVRRTRAGLPVPR